MKSLSIFMLFFVTIGSIAQEKTITGVIVDETNMPLPGATVVIKGSTTGTSTDFDGLYSISANVGDVLVYSYVGYSDLERTVGSTSLINVSMVLDNSLECVVVTALGTKRQSRRNRRLKRKVKTNYLQQSSNQIVVQNLAGKVTGLKISNSKVIRVKKDANKAHNIILKGNRSLAGVNSALIIVDGVVSNEENLRKINPNNIKGVNVLKGASGFALYGSRGNNGVIVISTKHNHKKLKKELDSLLRNHKNLLVNDDSYEEIKENNFERTHLSLLSTFSIDVDKASYANVRRMINNGQKVHPDAVKLEEFINYFEYKYPQPVEEHPFSITTEVNPTPWNKQTKLVRVGLQGKTIAQDNLPASNLVFLIDVSGSMGGVNKLGLLKKAFKFLTNQLREKDKVSIVVYAGAAGVVLEPTSGSNKQKIIEALNKLESGGSTAGGEGI